MHIALKVPGRIPIPAKLYGGTQRVIYWLGKALLELGHEVTVLGPPGCELPGADIRVLTHDHDDPRAWWPLIPARADLVHLWDTTTPQCEKPFLVTVEGNAKAGQSFHAHTVFVSRRHAANHGSPHFVYNGLDPADYSFSETRGDYAVFLAKARWAVKNFPGAVAVARRAGIPLHVLGSRNWPLNLQKLLPTIRGVKLHGMIGGEAKRALLARARCLIFPVRWEEPFGVALTEALVSGCYVVGTPYGSLPEIVTPQTGLLAADVAALADAARAPEKFSPTACRDRVWHGGFTHLAMAREYLKYYERVLALGRLGAVGEPAPQAPLTFAAKKLLPWTP
ncbi:MAG: hypothetical protein RLZZ350_2565 [Verrucomicrobiota bacterium]|jgi:glycosyltransferase involved in cell wall biosynthesis